MTSTLTPMEPVHLRLVNGEEVELLLSMGALRRVCRALKVKSMEELAAIQLVELAPTLLYEALMDKRGLSEDQFADLIPVQLSAVQTAITQLFNVSMGGGERPTEASLVNGSPSIGTGLDSGSDGLNGSDEPPPNSGA